MAMLNEGDEGGKKWLGEKRREIFPCRRSAMRVIKGDWILMEHRMLMMGEWAVQLKEVPDVRHRVTLPADVTHPGWCILGKAGRVERSVEGSWTTISVRATALSWAQRVRAQLAPLCIMLPLHRKPLITLADGSRKQTRSSAMSPTKRSTWQIRQISGTGRGHPPIVFLRHRRWGVRVRVNRRLMLREAPGTRSRGERPRTLEALVCMVWAA